MDINETLLRYIEGNADAKEKKHIILWLNEKPEHVQEYLKQRKLYDLQIWNTEKISSNNLSTPETAKKHVSRRIYTDILKIAASLIIGILGTVLFFSREAPDEELMTHAITVPASQRAELLLSDGTKVWLNSGTTLTYPEKFSKNAREVILDGEGYFKVKENKEKPFTVKTPQHDLLVLGTEFNVKAYSKSNKFEASLLSGSIEIIPMFGGEHLIMVPDEHISLHNDKLVRGTISDMNYFKWREGLLCFEKESISDLFTKLELYYDVEITVKKESLLAYSYTGKFRIRDGIEHVLRVLQLKHEFRYSKNDDLNLIVIE